VKKLFYVAVILFLGLSLAGGENHNHQQTAPCVGCLHAPVFITNATAPIVATLIEFGAVASEVDPQPLSRLGIPFTLLRAPPVV
jgi:hypothetical protein